MVPLDRLRFGLCTAHESQLEMMGLDRKKHDIGVLKLVKDLLC